MDWGHSMKKELVKIGTTGLGARLLNLDLLRLVETRLLATASSGGGKSFLLRTIIEGVYRRTQVIVLDTEGEFSTLRPAYDFIILGKDGDTGFHPYHGRAYALAFLESGKDVVIDLSELTPKEKQAFVRDFLQAMVDAPRALWHDVLVVLDEAHEFAPEGGSAVSSEAVISMASKGRKRGFALLMATQRPAKLSKDASAECQNKIIGLQNLPIDRKRAGDELGYSTKEELLLLRDMDPGNFAVCGPAFILDKGERLRGVEWVVINMPKTRPPKRGAARVRVSKASGKLRAELEKLAALPKVTEQEARTVSSLSAEIADLKRQLAKKPTPMVQAAPTGPTAAQLKAAETQAQDRIKEIGTTMGKTMMSAAEELNKLAMMATHLKASLTRGHDFWAQEKFTKALAPAKPTAPKYTVKHDPAPEPKMYSDKAVKAYVKNWFSDDVDGITAKALEVADDKAYLSAKLTPPEKAILGFLNMRPGVYFPKRRVAAMAGYSASSGSFRNACSSLSTRGFIVRRGQDLALKDALDVEALVQGITHTLEGWIAKMSPPEKAIIKLLREQGGQVCLKDWLAEHSGYAASSGSFRNALSRLTTMGLIVREEGGFALHPEAETWI